MTDNPEIQVRLLEVMGKRNIRTIKEVSKKTGLSRKAVSTILKNQTHKMNTDTIAKICEGLECEIGELLVLKKDKEDVG